MESVVVTSPCPLLAPEPADDFLPAACMRVPRNSAWISMQLDLGDYAGADGIEDRDALAAALDRCIDDGDRRHEEAEWPEPLIEYDSWLNRRLAIALRGWGDLVHRRGADPQAITTLREMESLAEWICTHLQQRSRAMASGSNWCPALDATGARIAGKNSPRRWGRRWRRAIREVALRHRNLTTLSPWDLFPRAQPADLRYADLLPLTRFADALAFQCDVDIAHWNASDFRRFRDRVSAQVRVNGGSGLIAKQL